MTDYPPDVPILRAPGPWTALALCPQVGGELFFPSEEEGGHYEVARRVCALCPVAYECAEEAIVMGDTEGMWGGLTPSQRRRIRQERGLE